ncbi:MAG: translation initiation factor IF-1 [Verrucomicrobia bacterium]|nr:translation initiation factor IF-1 [Verrucomicrobiota bacterium]MBI3869480.1 translation initiation factor IF-1 [Verrucomicrobiota bacterium]
MIGVLRPRLFRVALSNGHALFAHMTARSAAEWGALSVDDRVVVEVTPFDLSSGRIRDVAKKNLI